MEKKKPQHDVKRRPSNRPKSPGKKIQPPPTKEDVEADTVDALATKERVLMDELQRLQEKKQWLIGVLKNVGYNDVERNASVSGIGMVEEKSESRGNVEGGRSEPVNGRPSFDNSVNPLVSCSIDWLIDWLIVWLIVRLIVCMIDWLID